MHASRGCVRWCRCDTEVLGSLWNPERIEARRRLRSIAMLRDLLRRVDLHEAAVALVRLLREARVLAGVDQKIGRAHV